MSSDLKYNFCFVAEEIFELGNTTKTRCLGVRVEAQANGKFRSIRGRQATVNALIGNEHYPIMRRLRISIRLSVTKTELVPNTIRKLGILLTYAHDSNQATAAKQQ